MDGWERKARPSPSTARLAQFRRGFSPIGQPVGVYLRGAAHVRGLVAWSDERGWWKKCLGSVRFRG